MLSSRGIATICGDRRGRCAKPEGSFDFGGGPMCKTEGFFAISVESLPLSRCANRAVAGSFLGPFKREVREARSRSSG